MKVETVFISSITASPIGRARIFVIMYVDTFITYMFYWLCHNVF